MSESNDDMSETEFPEAAELDEQSPPPRREPVFNMPGFLVVVILFMVGLYAVQAAWLSDRTAMEIDLQYGFIPARYVYPFFAGDYSWAWTPLTYSFLHGSVEHLVFNVLWLMAFATPVVRRIGTRRSILFWVISAIASAAFYAALHWGEVQLVIGASGVISAFMGAACRFAFPPPGLVRDRRPVHYYPLLTIGRVLQSRMAVSFLLLWLVGNIAVAFGLPLAGSQSAVIAWEAHVGGLLFGFFAIPLFERRNQEFLFL